MLKVPTKNRGHTGGGVRVAPSFRQTTFNTLKSGDKPYNAESIARFLGWMSGKQFDFNDPKIKPAKTAALKITGKTAGLATATVQLKGDGRTDAIGSTRRPEAQRRQRRRFVASRHAAQIKQRPQRRIGASLREGKQKPSRRAAACVVDPPPRSGSPFGCSIKGRAYVGTYATL